MHVTAGQVGLVVGVAVAAAVGFRLFGWALYVAVCHHLDRLDAEVDGLLPDHPRD